MTETERERLKKLIRQVWGSQRACAAELGIGEEHLSDILRGKYPIPGTLLTLVARKGQSIDALFDRPPGIAVEQQSDHDLLEHCAARLSNAELVSIIQRRLGVDT